MTSFNSPLLSCFEHYYYIARAVFGFSEKDFWESNPRKIHFLYCMHLISHGKAHLSKSFGNISENNKRNLFELAKFL